MVSNLIHMCLSSLLIDLQLKTVSYTYLITCNMQWKLANYNVSIQGLGRCREAHGRSLMGVWSDTHFYVDMIEIMI